MLLKSAPAIRAGARRWFLQGIGRTACQGGATGFKKNCQWRVMQPRWKQTLFWRANRRHNFGIICAMLRGTVIKYSGPRSRNPPRPRIPARQNTLAVSQSSKLPPIRRRTPEKSKVRRVWQRCAVGQKIYPSTGFYCNNCSRTDRQCHQVPATSKLKVAWTWRSVEDHVVLICLHAKSGKPVERFGNQRQIFQAARVDSSQRPLAGCVAHSGGAPLNALDVSFDRVQPDVPHGHTKSIFLSEPSLLECNRATQRCLHRERSTRTNVRVNELFKLAVDYRANGRWDAFVGASVVRRDKTGME